MSVHSRSKWNLEMLVFEERGKPEYPEKNVSEQRNVGEGVIKLNLLIELSLS